MANPTIVQGNPRPLYGGKIYEKTSSDNETVNKRLLMQGTAANQLKLCSAASVPIAIGIEQLIPGFDSDNKPDSDMCKDGEMITHRALDPGMLVRFQLSL